MGFNLKWNFASPKCYECAIRKIKEIIRYEIFYVLFRNKTTKNLKKK